MKLAVRGACLAFALSLGGCGASKTPSESVRAFFEQIAAGQTAEAFESATPGFREQQTLSFFQTTLHELGLDTIESSRFDSPEYKDEHSIAKIEGTFTTKRKTTVSLVITLMQFDGAWRVLSMKTPRDRSTGNITNYFTMIGRDVHFIDPTQHYALPTEAMAKEMTHDSLVGFNRAVQSKSFLEFFQQCSLRWQDQLATGEPSVVMAGTSRKPLTERQKELGAGRLLHAFQAFIDQQIDIGGLDGLQPVFDRAPWVNSDGLLVLSGYYPTKPVRVVFNLRYTFELPQWKLFGLDVSLSEPG